MLHHLVQKEKSPVCEIHLIWIINSHVFFCINFHVRPATQRFISLSTGSKLSTDHRMQYTFALITGSWCSSLKVLRTGRKSAMIIYGTCINSFHLSIGSDLSLTLTHKRLHDGFSCIPIVIDLIFLMLFVIALQFPVLAPPWQWMWIVTKVICFCYN